MLPDARIRGLRCWAICSAAILIIISEGGEVRGQTNPNANATTGTASKSSVPAPPGLAPSGVQAISSAVLPNPLQGPSLAPAAVPGDASASMALRHNLAGQLKGGRN